MSLNVLTIVGNLGRDPEMEYNAEGRASANFSVASTRRYRDRDGELQDETIWFTVDVYGRLAENANQYLNKGDRVTVHGRLKPPRAYVGDDGEAKASLYLFANDVVFPPRAWASEDTPQPDTNVPATPPAPKKEEDEFPF